MEKKNTVPPRLRFKGTLYGDKWYSCPHCNYSLMENEIADREERERENTYSCPDCFRLFYYKR